MPHRHVLIVEDQRTKALNIRNRLARLGYEVISLIDSSEEKEIVATTADDSPELEVVLLDFLHDVETSDPSAEKRAKKALSIPVIFVPAKNEKAKKSLKTKLPLPGFIVKPFDDLALQETIKLAADSNRYRIDSEKKNEKKFIKKDSWVSESATKNTKKGEEEALDLVQQIPMFSQLPEKALKELVRRSHFANVAAGEYIAFEGEEDDASFIVVSGRFAMTKTAMNGKELVVELIGPGDFFGLIFAIEQLPAQLSARAQSDSEVLFIQTSILLAVLKENPELYKGFVEHLSRCLHISHTLAHGLAHDSVMIRIATLLLSLVTKFARVRKAASSPIVIDITRQQIADLTGTTPETATRVTRAMHKNAVINCGSPGVIRILDVEALKKLAEEEEF